ncbi:TPA: NUDIX hydrolase [Thermoplasmata archaeon]|nr:NUDIX hydrolase [Thermoplasmata archaeon]
MTEVSNDRMYPARPLVGVGVVTIKDGKILLVKRAFDPGEGKWSVPGGLVEVGEKLSEAGARETLEETGVEVQVLELINVFDMIDVEEDGRTRYHYVLVDFLARPTGGTERLSSEITDLRWVAYDEAKSMDLTKTARRALSELFGGDIT